MSGRNAKLLRRIARRYRVAGGFVHKKRLRRWWVSLSQGDRGDSREAADRADREARESAIFGATRAP